MFIFKIRSGSIIVAVLFIYSNFVAKRRDKLQLMYIFLLSMLVSGGSNNLPRFSLI